eukprot:CAMPEP_0176046538 /NCGR_PEP_ID=MMETSP0120_2-20121206/23108_1 /TAXON_ID=160619 /ORGANISM="Kryptoperidinium foliaceum, Strain CCMP 1326" /LENGTH=547 /DNA_ID=CAMNT_0017379949 /DNA_START=51 /DNA_END=1690 /DNA_ORIENTATION=+
MALFDDLGFPGLGSGGYSHGGGGFVGTGDPRDEMPDFGDGLDADEELGLDTKQLRDAVLLVIDCTQPNALSPLQEGGRSLVAEGLAAASTLLKRKVVSAPEDKVGIALFGVREKLNPNGFEGIRVLQELDRPSALRIKQLEAEIVRTPASFEERYGFGRAVPLSDVFWTCTTVLNLAAPTKQFEPRVWLFTSNDLPCELPGEREAAETRARDLRDLGVSIEFFPLPHAGAKFCMERFWERVILVDADDFVDRAVVTLQNLERWIRMREHRKRTLQRLALHLCDGAEIGVSIYCTTIEAKVPQPVYLLNENNKLLKSETRNLCGTTGAILHPVDDIETFVELAGKRVYMSSPEVAETKQFGEPGMHLLGFKPATTLQPHHRIFHSYFVYPNERAVKGSSALCQALIDTMMERKLMAVIRYVARRNATPCLAVLLPQAEVVDEDGIQTRSPGFHMIRLPWGEEIRTVGLPSPELPPPSPDLAAAARRVVASMHLGGFRPGCAENPVLQKHYAAVQALALGEDKPAETVDVLQPDLKALEEKAPIFCEWR